jgi:hypothetical protein
VCPKVTGQFALRALGVQDDRWWGGVELDAPRDKDDLTSVPAGLAEWKRYLAAEYFRSYRRGLPAPPRPSPTPVEAPRAVETPAPDSGGDERRDDDGDPERGNGDGRGRDNDRDD